MPVVFLEGDPSWGGRQSVDSGSRPAGALALPPETLASANGAWITYKRSGRARSVRTGFEETD